MPAAGRQRIGLYIDGAELGGAELAVQNLVLASSNEFDYVLLSSENHTSSTIADRTGIEHHAVPKPSTQRRHPLQTRQAIDRAKVDLVQVTLCNPTAATVPLVASLTLGLPTIAVEQLVRPTKGIRRILKAAIARRLAGHVAVGQASATDTERLCWLKSGSITTIYNGIDIGEWPGRPPASTIERLVCVGRLEDQKGFDILLRALPDIPNVTLTIVGDGSQRSNLEHLAAALAVSERVAFTGWQADPKPYLRDADIFVLASRNEAFPLSIVEAMLHELPVVATNVGSVSESVRPGQTGVLVAPDDPGALAAAVNELIARPSDCALLGAAGRQVALAEFSAEATAAAFAELWRRVLAR